MNNPDAPIPQFVHAATSAGITITPQDILSGLTLKHFHGINGKEYVVALTPSFPNTAWELGNIPLIIYSSETKPWKQIGLKDLGDAEGIEIGTVISSKEEMDLGESKGIYGNNFSIATIPYSGIKIPSDDGDTRYRLQRIKPYSPREIFLLHLIDDFPAGLGSEEKILNYVNNTASHVVGLYGNEITTYNGLNECHNPNPCYKFWNKYGDDFLAQVYQTIRGIIPKHAKLIYNETDNYRIDDSFYAETLRIVQILKAKNLIDAVGMQMHMSQNQYARDIDEETTIKIMKSFETPVYVTELDVNQTPMSGTAEQKLVKQAQIYEIVVRSCVRSGVCPVINFWGFIDRYSWLEYAGYDFNVTGGSPEAKPCIFDDFGDPKIAYYAVLRGLMANLNQ